jgi:hypothetical protein
MEMVKLLALGLVLSGLAAASDFSIEIGSPVAAMTPENTVRVKKTGTAFSVRTKDCADPGSARFSGTAVWMNGAKRESSQLQLLPGTTPGTYVVTAMDRMTEPWIAVITAECSGAKAGALVPVNAIGSYDRASARMVSHAPTDAEIEVAVKQVKGGSK